MLKCHSDAGNLLVGDKLVSVNGEDLLIEYYYIKLTKEKEIII